MTSGLFNFSQEELLTFFAVLVRFSILFAILPFVGDRFVPGTVKILLSLAATLALFPSLVARGEVNPGQAAVWGATTGGIAGTIGLEVLCALILGFVARLVFDTINFGGNIVGTFMGFAAASTYDPHQESQTQVVAEIQLAIAMLLFLAVDGHHLLLRASLDSYRIVGLGGAGALLQNTQTSGLFSSKLIAITSEVFRLGIQLAAPVAVALFSVNVVFAVIAKSMPQLNILVLSFGISALVGLLVLFLSIPEFTGATRELYLSMGNWLERILGAMVGK